MSIKLKLTVNNIGPHSGANAINDSRDVSNLKMAIYAQNGSGKTFISRMFALSNNNNNTNDYSHFLTLNKSNGDFSYNISDQNKSYEYSVKIQQGNPAIINNTSGYIYHVFNSDYVRKNIDSHSFVIDGNSITGVIIGEANIDLSKERQLLSNYQSTIENISSSIKSNVLSYKQMLAKHNVKSNTNEYININYTNVIAKHYTTEKDSVDSIIEDLDKIENLPDNIAIAPKNPIIIDLDAMSEVETLLLTSFNRLNIDERVMNKIRNHFDFYKTGLIEFEQSDNNICPFCNQKMQENGIYYINLYRQFFNNEESQIINEIEERISFLKGLKNQFSDFNNEYNRMKSWFYKYRAYIPDYKNIELLELDDYNGASDSIDKIIESLKRKKANISSVEFDITAETSIITELKSAYFKTFNISLNKVESLEKVLANSTKKKLEIKKQLCNSVMNKLILTCESEINELEKCQKEINELENRIEEMESDIKSDKRKLVIKSMKQFLGFFFHDKYLFNEERFMLEFNNHVIDSDANSILSDGEKSVIAFCYYLASTHILMSRDKDYEKLYFVIDDPISSLDFNYVYAVTGIIKNLKKYFPKLKRERFIILTHNAEFMASLISNKITSSNLYLRDGSISIIKDELLMPYEYHLSDIYKVSIGKETPSHTTANSIRHVLETIMRFDDPKNNNGILDYINNNEILSQNRYLFTYMHDLSHGRYRIEKAITNDEIVSICKTVCEFVNKKFSKQLEAIK